MAGFENDVVFALNGDFSQSDNQAPAETNGLVTNGQLWIGSTALNAGSTHINVGVLTSPNASVIIGYSTPNITLTVNPNVLFNWFDVSGAFLSSSPNGYFVTNTASSTLPAGSSQGDTIKYILDTANALTLTASPGTRIRIGAIQSSVAGTATSTAIGDSLTLVYRASDQTWIALNTIGTWVLA
ncbi:MAG TPA: hypothetical protein VGK47_14795 [Nitrososphaeraceae archaeon]